MMVLLIIHKKKSISLQFLGSSWGSNVAAGGLGAAGGLAAGSYANKYKYPKSSWFSSVTVRNITNFQILFFL